jgi:hypothetical protein
LMQVSDSFRAMLAATDASSRFPRKITCATGGCRSYLSNELVLDTDRQAT